MALSAVCLGEGVFTQHRLKGQGNGYECSGKVQWSIYLYLALPYLDFLLLLFIIFSTVVVVIVAVVAVVIIIIPRPH